MFYQKRNENDKNNFCKTKHMKNNKKAKKCK